MHVRLLGTAAGGGVPQWNCNCPNCKEARRGTGRVRPRTQSSAAFSADGNRWFLLNASPDIGRQIESFPPLQPARFHPRGTSIQGVLLTNADMDHTLGLLLLREGAVATIHASRETEVALTNGLGLLPALRSFCKTKIVRVSRAERRLRHADGSPSALSYQAFEVPGKRPRFAAKIKRGHSVASGAIGYKIRDLNTGGRLIYVPEILRVTESLAEFMNNCELLLFDGTCWSDDEMARRGIAGPTAAKMGHVPINGAGGSLRALAGVTFPRKVYVHINNTNPILFEKSPERRRVVAAGWQIGEDGMEFKI
jgi:pyrroloquinoline quinone biosynthesis protein B